MVNCEAVLPDIKWHTSFEIQTQKSSEDKEDISVQIRQK